MNITLDLAWLEAVMLAAVRLTGFIIIAPPFSYKAFPGRIKAMIAIGLALAVSARVAPGYESLDTGHLIGSLIMEFSVGATLGFMVFLTFAAIQSAGNLIDMSSGFQMAQGFDPQAQINGAQFTKLFQMTALMLLFTTDGYQIIIAGIIRSFDSLPVGAALSMPVTAELLIRGLTGMFVSAVQIAGPIMVVLFLADAGLGLLNRVAPALNAFALGFPLKVLITLALAGTVFLALPRVVSVLVQTAANQLMGVR
ncbi:MAG TPA: flagellar biosynthetic protein FliR [Arthrobacter sp.]